VEVVPRLAAIQDPEEVAALVGSVDVQQAGAAMLSAGRGDLRREARALQRAPQPQASPRNHLRPRPVLP